MIEMSKRKRRKVYELLWDERHHLSDELGIPIARLICGYARQPMVKRGDGYEATCALTDQRCVQKYGTISEECPVYKRYFRK